VAEGGPGVWSSEAWRRRATAWADARLAEAGIRRTGAVEQPRVRPWATVLRVPTSEGVAWLKAGAAATAFEAGLYGLLVRTVPDAVLAPLAIDVQRGWILLPDGGRTLRESASGEDLVAALTVVLPRYGALQRTLVPLADELLGLGVADMRPAVMPARFDEALAAAGDYVTRRGDAADRSTHAAVAARRPAFAAWCERLADAPAAPTLDHNDLHPGNVLVADGLARARFYDWGDSVVAHPFATMLLPLGLVREDAGDSAMERVRDAYLEAFGDLASHAELVRTLELACRVAKIARALTWHRAISAAGPGALDDAWARGPVEHVASVLADSHL
jgi:hypothetical protein